MEIRTQIITCKCNRTLASKQEPFCLTDQNWISKIKEARQSGLLISTTTLNNITISKCICAKQATLF